MEKALSELSSSLSRMSGPLVAWRRHLHRHPEISFQERETAAYVADELRKLGFAPTHPTETSVVADLNVVGDGPTVALRADIDALQITEATGLRYASTRPGVMHACGHDAHTAVALGVAQVLREHEAMLRGPVRFIFQHAEEMPPHGSSELIPAGVLDGVDAIVGAHVWTPMPLGVVALCRGAAMASVDFFEVVLSGNGGHSGMPHTADDIVGAATAIVAGIRSLTTTARDPMDPVALVVTRIHTGEAHNVMPGTASVGGTIRCLAPDTRAELARRIRMVAEAAASGHGISASFQLNLGTPPLRNDDALTSLALELAADLGFESNEMPPMMGGDDFALYLDHVPGVYAFVGAGTPGTGGPFPHHHPAFQLEEGALDVACSLLSHLMLRAQDHLLARRSPLSRGPSERSAHP